MGKRFTDSEKWRDKWFRALSPELKLAWLYLLDNCDCAGVIDIDEELANFQIGFSLVWGDVLTQFSGRIERLKSGKFFIVRFVEFQYGTLSKDCRAHNPIYASIEKHKVSDRVFNGYSTSIQRVLDKEQDKDKDKDKEQDKDKDRGVQGGEEWIVPESLDCDQVRSLLKAFYAMRIKIKKPISDRARASIILKQFESQEHLIFALETCIANDYQGLKPEYRPIEKPTSKKILI